MPADTTTLQCSSCGRTFPWKAEYAGRQAKCPCGTVMVYPAAPAMSAVIAPADVDLFADDRGEYDLAPTPRAQPVAAAVQPAQTAEAVSQAPTGAVSAALNYQPAPQPHALDSEKLTKLTVPVWVLAGGLLVESLFSMFVGRQDPTAAVLHLLFDVGVGSVLMMVAVLIAARVREIHVGSLPSALLRLAAICVGTQAVHDVLGNFLRVIPRSGILVLFADFILYFVLLGMFFDLDESDTWYCLSIIFLVNIAVHFTLPFLLPG